MDFVVFWLRPAYFVKKIYLKNFLIERIFWSKHLFSWIGIYNFSLLYNSASEFVTATVSVTYRPPKWAAFTV